VAMVIFNLHLGRIFQETVTVNFHLFLAIIPDDVSRPEEMLIFNRFHGLLLNLPIYYTIFRLISEIEYEVLTAKYSEIM
jgi:hypothetical protein